MGKPTGEMLAKAGEKYLGRKYGEMDCQAFAERCLRDIGVNLNLAGSNAWYRKMTWVGTPEECRARFGMIPNGAFLFILEQDGGQLFYKAGGGITAQSDCDREYQEIIDKTYVPLD